MIQIVTVTKDQAEKDRDGLQAQLSANEQALADMTQELIKVKF